MIKYGEVYSKEKCIDANVSTNNFIIYWAIESTNRRIWEGGFIVKYSDEKFED